MSGDVLLKQIIAVNYYQVHMTLMTLRRSPGQRSRSRSRSTSDGHRNLWTR